MNKLTTWNIPIGEILVLNDKEYRYKGIKRTRQRLKGIVPIQLFSYGRGANKDEIRLSYGLPVELKEDGKYYRVID